VNVSPHGLAPDEFFEHLAGTRVLLGTGRPPLSPTPYDALCFGVPFVNPVVAWDAGAPDDRARWRTQHDGLKWEAEPRVYHVRLSRDLGERRRDFWAAIQRAMSTPIERYVLREMSQDAVTERLSRIVETDWLAPATEVLAKKQLTGSGALISL